MKGLTLSGGYGTRLTPPTHTRPKQLISIANKPYRLNCIENLRDAGIMNIEIILGSVMPEKAEEFLGYASRFGVKLSYIVQGKRKGIAHAVNSAKRFMEQELLVVYRRDNLIESGIKPISEKMKKENADCVISLMPVKESQRYGMAELSPDGTRVLRTVEKPSSGINVDMPAYRVNLLRVAWNGS